MEFDRVINGDCLDVLKTLDDGIFDMCITSPPYYGLRDYGTGKWIGGDPNCPHYRTTKISENTATGHKAMAEGGHPVGDAIYKTVCPICGAVREDDQIGLEETPEEYVDKLVKVFREVRRTLKDDGTLWLNIGDTYNVQQYHKSEQTNGYGKQGTNKGSFENVVERPRAKNSKPKDLIGIPWMLAFALREDGWYLRQDIIWQKPNPMPEPVKDRCVKSHEYIFLLSKKPQYYFDYEAIQEQAVSKPTIPGAAANSKYADTEEEELYRQGMSRDRGNNIVELRKHLPPKEAFVDFMRSRTSVSALAENTDINRTTIEHWFRTDDGFSYPSVEQWETIRDYVDDWSEQFQDINERMTDVTYETDEIGKNSEGKRNKRDVWSVPTQAVKEAHFATYPEKLIEPCILAGSRVGGVVLDPFFGSGTTGLVSARLNRKYLGIELNEEYVEICNRRTSNVQMSMVGMI